MFLQYTRNINVENWQADVQCVGEHPVLLNFVLGFIRALLVRFCPQTHFKDLDAFASQKYPF